MGEVVWFFVENPKEGGGSQEGKGGEGQEGVCREFGGGAKYFLGGPKFPPSS